MKTKLIKSICAAIVISAATLIGCADYFGSQTKKQINPRVISSQLVVQFTATSTIEERLTVLNQFSKKEKLDKNGLVYVLTDATLDGKEASIATEVEKNSAVEFAEPNFRVQALEDDPTPRDPYYLRLWGMKNYGQDTPSGVEGVENADIGALTAWSKTTGSREIKVAVIDTGIDYTHPDLAANIWVNVKEKNGIPGVDDDGNGYVDDLHGWDAVSDQRGSMYYGQVGDPDPMDDMSHGTHCAGTIGAVGGNGIGVVGVNWTVSLVAVKFLDANGSGSTVDEYRALQYILANDIDVVSGSYGGGAESKLIESAMKEGERKGILFVFAAGNESQNNDTTANFPSNFNVDAIIAVAATDSRDQIADFSNYGQSTVDIAAPGVNILSTIPVKIAAESGGEPYAVFSGTSMATPHVAGAAALLLAADPSLRKNPLKLKERLLRTAEFKPQLASMVGSGGRLSISRAINNDTSGHPGFAGQWEELAYSVETPRNPTKRIDNAWEIKVPGAKAIRVHVKFAQIEDSFDVALLYDGQYRPAMNISGEVFDQWSPIMMGDTAYLKFSNSIVKIDGGEPFANFNSMGVQIDKVMVLR